jgi:SnoaL-like domain
MVLEHRDIHGNRSTDRRELHELVLRLARAIDGNDREGILACYHSDAVNDHGEFKGPAEGFADWVAMLHRERVESMSHLIANHLVEIAGDEARGETYVHVYLNGRPTGGQRFLMTGIGRYLDRFERRDAVWRIARRLVLTDIEHTDILPATEADSLVRQLNPGLASLDDPSYAHFCPDIR